MIVCPNCKEEIDDESRFCDQCGQELSYCCKCSRVGMGRRCTFCGGLMMKVDELKEYRNNQRSDSFTDNINMSYTKTSRNGDNVSSTPPVRSGIPTLTLYNPSLNLRMVGINGAIIGRRQGPYQQLFDGNMYISGTHAQLIYKPDSGWCIIDKHSSNGTKLNQRDMLPDIPMSIKSGDIVTLANINLQVSVV